MYICTHTGGYISYTVMFICVYVQKCKEYICTHTGHSIVHTHKCTLICVQPCVYTNAFYTCVCTKVYRIQLYTYGAVHCTYILIMHICVYAQCYTTQIYINEYVQCTVLCVNKCILYTLVHIAYTQMYINIYVECTVLCVHMYSFVHKHVQNTFVHTKGCTLYIYI